MFFSVYPPWPLPSCLKLFEELEGALFHDRIKRYKSHPLHFHLECFLICLLRIKVPDSKAQILVPGHSTIFFCGYGPSLSVLKQIICQIFERRVNCRITLFTLAMSKMLAEASKDRSKFLSEQSC